MAGPAHGEVWCYKDKHFGGTVWKFNETKDSFEDLGCNNKISSIRVGPGTTAVLFEDRHFNGGAVEYNVDTSKLGKMEDKSSSLRILKDANYHAPTPAPGEVYLYRDENFEGYCWRLADAIPNVAQIGAAGKVSSVRVGPGVEALLYKDAGYSGKVLTASHNMANLGSDFNDKVVSVKIFKK